MDDNWKTPNPYGEFRGVASVGEGSTQCRRTDERHGAWQLGWGAGYSDRCPEGWMVVQAGEIQRLHNECEALRVERDSARASDEPLVSLTREGREWAAVQVRDLGSLAAQRGRRIPELEAELQVIRAHLLSQETAEAMQLAIVSTHREDKRPEMWALSAVYTSAALAVIAAALAAADREAPDEAEGQKITHGRHCTCTPCAVEDWTNPAFAPCGMHGKDCPQEYQPLGPAGSFTPPADEPKETTT